MSSTQQQSLCFQTLGNQVCFTFTPTQQQSSTASSGPLATTSTFGDILGALSGTPGQAISSGLSAAGVNSSTSNQIGSSIDQVSQTIGSTILHSLI
jgi:hypothetical protein